MKTHRHDTRPLTFENFSQEQQLFLQNKDKECAHHIQNVEKKCIEETATLQRILETKTIELEKIIADLKEHHSQQTSAATQQHKVDIFKKAAL